MRKYLLSAALAGAFCLPTYAHATVCTDGFCVVDESLDGDELKMDADVANKGVTKFFGSVHGNGASQFTPDITITTTKNELMVFETVNTDSGYGEIKPVKDGLLHDLLFTVNPTAQNAKTLDVVHNLFDGFFTRAQVIGPTTTSDVLVDLLINGKDLFKFDITPNDRDFKTIGVDEETDLTANLLSTAEFFIDPANALYSFKSVKQIDWSPCAEGSCVGINPTGGVPEPSTWAMGLIGFGIVGFMSWRKRAVFA